MAQLMYTQLVAQLRTQLNELSLRCQQLDNTIKQTENHCFVFEVHIFSKRSLSLTGYIEQMQQTLNSLQEAINKQLPELLIQHECELFISQFHVLLKLVQGLEKGQATRLYKSYSVPKEQIFQQLQKQYQYEHRLLEMISEQEEILARGDTGQNSYIKEKIAALKIRYQKCNTFTQKLEFKLEENKDD